MKRFHSVFLFGLFSRLACLCSFALIIALSVFMYIMVDDFTPISIIIAILLILLFSIILFGIRVFTTGIFVRPKKDRLTLSLGVRRKNRIVCVLSKIQSVNIEEKENGWVFILTHKSGVVEVKHYRFHRFSYRLFSYEVAQYDRLKRELKQLNHTILR